MPSSKGDRLEIFCGSFTSRIFLCKTVAPGKWVFDKRFDPRFDGPFCRLFVLWDLSALSQVVVLLCRQYLSTFALFVMVRIAFFCASPAFWAVDGFAGAPLLFALFSPLRAEYSANDSM